MRRGHSPATSVCLALVAPLRQCLRSEARREMQVESSVFVQIYSTLRVRQKSSAAPSYVARTLTHADARADDSPRWPHAMQLQLRRSCPATCRTRCPGSVRHGEVETVDFPFSKRKHATESEVHSKEATGGSRRGRFRWHSYHVMV